MYALHTFSTNVMNVWFEHILHKEWSYDIHYSVTLNCLVSETLNHLKSFQKQAPWRSLCSAAPNWLLIVTSVPLLPYLCIFVVLPAYCCCLTCVSLLPYLCITVVLPMYLCFFLPLYLFCLTCEPLLSYLCTSVVIPVYICCLTCVSLLFYLCTAVVPVCISIVLLV